LYKELKEQIEDFAMIHIRIVAVFTLALSLVCFAALPGANAEDKPDVSIQTIDTLQGETIVTVQGTVESIRDEDEFILKDETGSIQIYIGPNTMPVSVGDEVTVKGMFDNDVIEREIYAHELTDTDGNVTTFERRYE
jgi:uncharacterized protein YdeI (BOF family)